MNERIQEIKHLCYIPKSQDQYDMEKFAELIVRDCAKIAEEYVREENNKLVEEVVISAYDLQDKIKEHFGFEP